MFRKLKLGTKFTLLLSLVLVLGILVAGLALWRVMEQQAEREVTARGLLLIETMNSVRNYTSTQIQPLLAEELAVSPEFISQSVPAFSAREVFEIFRVRDDNENFFYKEATVNPTNPRDLADPFELDLVNQMRQNPVMTEITGFRSRANEQMFFIARPLAITAESCLACHSTPDEAPASLISTYGAEGGFGWQVGEIVAAQMIYVPEAGAVYRATWQSFTLVLALFVLVFAVAIVVLNYLLSSYVIRPVGTLGQLAQKIETDEMITSDLETPQLAEVTDRVDELGELGRLLQRMAGEVYERTQGLKQQIKALRIEIDQTKKNQQVQEIVETDYFRDLQAKAEAIRQQRDRKRKRDD